jgi:TPR repeat protein
VSWFRKAADQGYADAQYNLGLMYADGQGVTQDDTAAMSWFRRAADQGNAAAQFNLAMMYGRGQGVPQSYIIAYMWFNLAAARGDKDSVQYRDVAAAKTTPAQIAEAQRLAREWKPTQK